MKITFNTFFRQSTSCLSSLAFGCMCYLMHTIIGEVSVLSRYTVTGHNAPSPAPNPWRYHFKYSF